MRHHVRFELALFAATLMCLASVGCEPAPGGASGKAGDNSASSAATQLPAGLFVTAAPADAKEIAAAKEQAREGQPIVVRGRIGGGKSPFVDNRAMFTLADASMPACSDNPGDTCATPWDYCCEPKDKITRLTATVQVVSPDGKPLKVGLNGVSSLKPLAEVIVKGRVSQKKDDQILVIDANEIYVKKS